MNVGHLITSYGYWALFVLVAAESVGVPLPGETALIVAGTYAGTTHNLSPWLVFAVAATAAIVGDNIGYWVGDKGGYPLARRYGPKVRLDERKLKTARYLFDRYGVPVVFFGRFVSVLRAFVAFLAGTSRMPWRKFLPANAAGGIVWAAIYTAASYFAGSALQRASGTIDLGTGRRGGGGGHRGVAAGPPPVRTAGRACRGGLPRTTGQRGRRPRGQDRLSA